MEAMMFMNIRHLLKLILLLVPLNIFSQVSAGSISVTVTDPNGALIPEAVLFLEQEDNPVASLTVKTGTNGVFVFENLGRKVYLLKVSQISFQNESEHRIDLIKNKHVKIQVKLGLACSKLSDTSVRSAKLTDKDLAETVRQTLVRAIDKLPSDKDRGKVIILSTQNIDSSWITGNDFRKIKLMHPEKIQQKAEREGDFLYMSFSEVRVIGRCIGISVNYLWAVGKSSKLVHLSGGGLAYEYRKKSGKWVGKNISNWVF
jgi:hypothetical protein